MKIECVKLKWYSFSVSWMLTNRSEIWLDFKALQALYSVGPLSLMLCLDFMSSSWLFSPQVRERLRVALERVSMLEDQLAASSQEVKLSTDDSLSLQDARMFGVKRNEKKEQHSFVSSVCPFCLPLSR